jgi:hypothetical protein
VDSCAPRSSWRWPWPSGTTGLAAAARKAVLVASGAIALVGFVAGAVRILPWLLDPAVSFRVAGPFARGLGAVALESALLVGWPVGWALACFRLVERGEAGVLQALGERPWATVTRLVPQGSVLVTALAAIALVYGRDASEPGRVATELVTQARLACLSARVPTTYAVPFTQLTWLCAGDPSREPRLVGSPPGPVPPMIVTARGAKMAGDFRTLELDDARVLLAGPAKSSVEVHVGRLTMRGLAPWAQASTIAPVARALVLALSACFAAFAGAYAALRRARRSRLAVLAFSSAGPLAALALIRGLERASAPSVAFAIVPVVAGGCTVAAAFAIEWLLRLRGSDRAASTTSRV